MQFIIHGKGHTNILAEHETTIEFTKEHQLTRNGDCVVAVDCDKACADLPEEFKKKLKSGAKIRIRIRADNIEDELTAYGSPKLVLTHTKDIVIRKSDFVDGRTLAVRARKSAKDLSRKLVEKIKNNNSKLEIILETGL